MGDIVDITENLPHKVSEVICVKCGHRWIAVRPEDSKLRDLECPNCTKQGYAIETGEVFKFENRSMEQEERNMSKQDILDYFSDINYAYNDSARLDTLSRMLDELVEQAASPWHRVEDELPESGEFGEIVLACNDVGTVKAAYLLSNGKWYAANNTDWDAWTWMPNVTHWMPLPEPPKEDA